MSARTVPLRGNKVEFAANGVGGAYPGAEGVYEFGARSGARSRSARCC